LLLLYVPPVRPLLLLLLELHLLISLRPPLSHLQLLLLMLRPGRQQRQLCLQQQQQWLQRRLPS
jgi:hypothetical protein